MPRIAATRRELNNILINGDFEFAPVFTAPTTTSGRFIDGSAAGSTTTNQYRWSYNGTASSSAQFDSTVAHTGTTSLKASTLAAASFTELFYRRESGGIASYNAITDIKVLPSTSYTASYWLKTNVVSGDSSDGAFLVLIENTAAGAGAGAETSVGAKSKVTSDWTLKTVTFTTQATTASLQINPRIYGHTGAGTLIMDAWWDDIKIGPTTPITRGVA